MDSESKSLLIFFKYTRLVAACLVMRPLVARFPFSLHFQYKDAQTIYSSRSLFNYANEIYKVLVLDLNQVKLVSLV